jgi:hypothetical protein
MTKKKTFVEVLYQAFTRWYLWLIFIILVLYNLQNTSLTSHPYFLMGDLFGDLLRVFGAYIVIYYLNDSRKAMRS